MAKVSRRKFISTSAAVAAGAAVGSLPKFSKAAGNPNKVIAIFAQGGWDQTYNLDPKEGLSTIEVPFGELKNFGNMPLWIANNTPAVETFFNVYSSISVAINGINIRSIAHPECSKQIFTGTQSASNPDFCAIAAYELAPDLPIPYFTTSNTSFLGPLASFAGRAGLKNQIAALANPALYNPLQGASPYFEPNSEDETLIRDYLQKRAERAKAVVGSQGYNQNRVNDFLASQGRAANIRDNHPNDFGNIGSVGGLTTQINKAVDALRKGISQVVSISYGGWDTHGNNFVNQDTRQETLFTKLKDLADTLRATPGSQTGYNLLDETTVIVFSEMGRTPLTNGNAGKDHWPVASALAFGANVAGNKVVGKTNDLFEADTINLDTGAYDANGDFINIDTFAAGILELVGVDATKYFPTTTPLRAIVGT